MSIPDISVRVITYNQVHYVRQTLDSVLGQVTGYTYDIVVGDDCSTDGTTRILEEYAERYPTKITLIKRRENIGANQNEIRTRAACPGRYVALLDGDDYWTDKAKLQKQVSFLESHPDFVMCFHNALQVDEVNKRERVFNRLKRDEFSGADMLKQWLITNSSLVYRNPHLPDPEFFHHTSLHDLALMLVLSEHGRIKYLPEVMSVYRIHPTGLSVTGFRGLRHNRKSVLLFRHLDRFLSFKYHTLLLRRTADYYLSSAVLYLYDRKLPLAWKYFKKAVSRDWRVMCRQPGYAAILSVGFVSPDLILWLKRLSMTRSRRGYGGL